MHGGVDGYSRIPVYLHASNNNRGETVLALFEKLFLIMACLQEFALIKVKKTMMLHGSCSVIPREGLGVEV